MNNKTVQILLTVAVGVTLIAVGAWYHASSALHDSRAQFVTDTLEPVSVLLKENQALAKELETDPFAENNAGILAAYLAKIRRDGVAKHADMKQRLDQLSENNTAIAPLIKVYAPEASTPAFPVQAVKVR